MVLCLTSRKQSSVVLKYSSSLHQPERVVAGGAMRAVCESVGITDCLAKSKGSSNPHNLVKATILALAEMRDAKMIAQNRGVNLDKVFRG